MIELTIFDIENQPYPQKKEIYESEYVIIKKYKLTLDEIRKGLKNKTLIRGRFLMDLAPAFVNDLAKELNSPRDHIRRDIIEALNDLAIEDIIDCDYNGAEVPREDIMQLLGLSWIAYRLILHKAVKKIKANPDVKNFLYNIIEFKKIKSEHADDYQIVTKTKITITME
jgi:hypothetical protein